MEFNRKEIATILFGLSVLILSSTGLYMLSRNTNAATVLFASAGIVGAGMAMLQFSDSD